MAGKCSSGFSLQESSWVFHICSNKSASCVLHRHAAAPWDNCFGQSLHLKVVHLLQCTVFPYIQKCVFLPIKMHILLSITIHQKNVLGDMQECQRWA